MRRWPWLVLALPLVVVPAQQARTVPAGSSLRAGVQSRPVTAGLHCSRTSALAAVPAAVAAAPEPAVAPARTKAPEPAAPSDRQPRVADAETFRATEALDTAGFPLAAPLASSTVRIPSQSGRSCSGGGGYHYGDGRRGAFAVFRRR